MGIYAMSRRSILGFCLVVALALATYLLRPGSEPPSTATSVASAMGGGSQEGYRRAYEPRPFVFPADHGPHPEYRVEWWYVTGNLADAGNRHFGYQLTLFRIAMSPERPIEDSAWRTNQIYMAHFAVTDVANERHYNFERFSRAAVGLAGAQTGPVKVWLENWSLTGGSNGLFPLRVEARNDDIAIDLALETTKPVVLQGEAGLSRKSAEPGNASYYYSYTRLATRGTVRINGTDFDVTGTSWLDREWSTSALGPEQTGWDWFALQLDDGRDLMFYRLRSKDGGVDPHSSGVLVATDGAVKRLSRDDVVLETQGTWQSPETGDQYPAAWSLRVPSEVLALRVIPRVLDQEMDFTVRYWEGAVTVQGEAGEKPITGKGYLEMTRYNTS
jgi:predicted secreted hydrolase